MKPMPLMSAAKLYTTEAPVMTARHAARSRQVKGDIFDTRIKLKPFVDRLDVDGRHASVAFGDETLNKMTANESTGTGHHDLVRTQQSPLSEELAAQRCRPTNPAFYLVASSER